MPNTDTVSHARKFLRGEQFKFAEANELWKRLKGEDHFPCEAVLRQLREKPLCLSDGAPNDTRTREILCRQEALLTSKDPELDSATRHDEALNLLANEFEFIEDKELGGDEETLGIAGGICKRRWNDLGQLKDLVQAAESSTNAQPKMNWETTPTPTSNAAFLEDLLAAAGDRPAERRERAEKATQAHPERPAGKRHMVSTRRRTPKLCLGLDDMPRRPKRSSALGQMQNQRLWELRTMAEQLAQLAYLREERPLEHPPIRMFFENAAAGCKRRHSLRHYRKVGLALSAADSGLRFTILEYWRASPNATSCVT